MRKTSAAKIFSVRLGLGFGISVLAMVIFAGIWMQVRDKTAYSIEFDRSISYWMHDHRTPFLTFMAILMAYLGSTGMMIALAVAAIASGCVKKHLRGVAWVMPLSVAGAGILILTAKALCHRARPTYFPHLIGADGYSFPSGHSLFAMVIYGLVGYFGMSFTRRSQTRLGVIGLTLLLIVLIGASRVYVGVHYPTDVLAGWIGGIPWLITCIGIHEAISRRYRLSGDAIFPTAQGTPTIPEEVLGEAKPRS